MIPLLATGLGLVLAGGLSASLAGGRARGTLAVALGTVGALLGCGLAAAAAAVVLFGRVDAGSLAWPSPGAWGPDLLGAAFLLPQLVASGLGALFGAGEVRREPAAPAPRLLWPTYAILTGAGALVLSARTAGPLALGVLGVVAAAVAWRTVAGGPRFLGAVLSTTVLTGALYAVLRVTALTGDRVRWWGAAVLGVGAAAMLVGALRALRSDELPRRAVGWRVQRAGAIALATGLGALGVRGQRVDVALLGFGAALLHGLSYAPLSLLLGLVAEAVRQATGQTRLTALRGVFRRMRDTGAGFLAGAAAAAPLPPLCGVAGDLLLIAGALAALPGPLALRVPAAVTLAVVPAADAISIIAFGRAALTLFAGAAPGAEALSAREVASARRIPIHLLSGACLALGLFPAFALAVVARPAVPLAARAGMGMADALDRLFALANRAGTIAWAALAVVALGAAAGALRARRKGRPVSAPG